MGTTWGKFNDELKKQAKIKGVPISGQFELTARCNNYCKMCYVCKPAGDRESRTKEHSAKEWIKLAEEARDAGMLYLLLTGGEVFLRQDFMEIYNEISMMGIRVGIYTNATMITPDIAKRLGRIPPSRVEVTLYGATPETYGKVSGNPYGFEHALRGIDLLLAEGITLDLRTTVIHDNACDYDKISELAEERDIILKIVNYISPRRDCCTQLSDNMRLSPYEMVQYEKHAQESYITRMKKLHGDKFCALDSIEDKKDLNIDTHPFKCSAGRSEFWVTWDGKMTPCGLMEEPATLPFEEGFTAAWNRLKDACASISICSECSKCSLRDICFTCPARLKNETGFYDKPSPYLCEYAREKNTPIRYDFFI